MTVRAPSPFPCVQRADLLRGVQRVSWAAVRRRLCHFSSSSRSDRRLSPPPVNSSPDYLREVGIGNYPTEEVTDTVHQGGIVSIYCALPVFRRTFAPFRARLTSLPFRRPRMHRRLLHRWLGCRPLGSHQRRLERLPLRHGRWCSPGCRPVFRFHARLSRCHRSRNRCSYGVRYCPLPCFFSFLHPLRFPFTPFLVDRRPSTSLLPLKDDRRDAC